MNSILGWAQLMRTGTLDETCPGARCKRLSATHGCLLKSSTICWMFLESSAANLDWTSGRSILARWSRRRSKQFGPPAAAKHIHLDLSLDSTVGAVSGDPGRLQQVVWNLLSNAMKFTPDGGSVEVRLEGAGSNACITIQDTGEGIPEAFLPFVFDRFRQADSTFTRMHGGLGIGLAIVRHLVEMHGGSVTADSPGEDQGATFTVSLPLLTSRSTRVPQRKETGSLKRPPQHEFD